VTAAETHLVGRPSSAPCYTAYDRRRGLDVAASPAVDRPPVVDHVDVVVHRVTRRRNRPVSRGRVHRGAEESMGQWQGGGDVKIQLVQKKQKKKVRKAGGIAKDTGVQRTGGTGHRCCLPTETKVLVPSWRQRAFNAPHPHPRRAKSSSKALL
jgi:hypothetical protein